MLQDERLANGFNGIGHGMTPEQARAIADLSAAGLDSELFAAFERYRELIRAGAQPRDAVQVVMDGFIGTFRETMQTALAGILGASVGVVAAEQITVSAISLSNSLYRAADRVGVEVQALADRHARGFQDARRLALDIFEGYGFRADEPLKISPKNEALPKYMREALLSDRGLEGQLQRLFARMQAEKLKTAALRASYIELLDKLEAGKGRDVLEKRMRVAFYERMRYYATRIAQTELQRAYADRQAVELMRDTDVEYVQWRLSARHPRPDICDIFAKVDRYGLGPGVYPKAQAPKAPAHPHCFCALSPRLDISRKLKAQLDPEADAKYLRGLDPSDAAKVAGSEAKLEEALRGASVLNLWNRTARPEYRITTVGETAAKRGV